MTVKDLLTYIEENIADGCLTEQSQVNINDGAEFIKAYSLRNDHNELTIGV